MVGNWQKLVSKMIGDDVSGSFLTNVGVATFSEDFTSYPTQLIADAHWAPIGGTEIIVNIATDVIDWNFIRTGGGLGNRGVIFDLFQQGKFSTPLTLSGNWAMRWKMVFGTLVTPTTNTNAGTVGIFDAFSLASDAIQSFIGIKFSMDSGGSMQMDLVSGDAATPDTPTTVDTFTTTFASSATLFFELKRTAGGNIEATIYSDANYSVIIEKIKVTGIATAIDDLRFMRVLNTDNLVGDGSFTGTIGEVELFNESEGLQKFFTAKGDNKATSFDVIPDLVTAERIPNWIADLFDGNSGWVDAGVSEVRQVANAGLIECLVDADGGNDGIAIDLSTALFITPNFFENFKPINTWLQTGTEVFIDTKKEVLQADKFDSVGGNQSISHDLGSPVSDTAWVMRWRWNVDSTLPVVGNQAQMLFALSSIDGSNDISIAQDSLSVALDYSTGGTRRFVSHHSDGGAMTDNGNLVQDNITTSDPQTWYMELVRLSATSLRITAYSDSRFITVVKTETIVIPATITNLQFIKIQSITSTGPTASGFNTEIDDVRFWDGVTTVADTVSDTAWVLRGSFNIADFNGQNAVLKQLFIGMFDGNQVFAPTFAQDGLFFRINSDNTFAINKTGDADIGHSDGDTPQDNPKDATFTYDVFQPMREGRFFFELKRTSATTVECTFFDEGGFSFPLQTISATIPATITNLQFLKLTARIDSGTGRSVIYFDNFEFFNGVTDSCIFNTAPVLEQDTTESRMNYCNRNIFYSGFEDDTNNSISVDLGSTLSDSAFVMRCKIAVNDFNIQASPDRHWLGLFDVDSASAGPSVQSGIALRADTQNNAYNATANADTILENWGAEATYTTLIANGVFYLEIARLSSTQARVSLFRDKDFNDLIESRTFTIPATVNDLRFFAIKNRIDPSAGGRWEITVSKIQIWDNVNNADGFPERTVLEIFTTGNRANGVQNGNYHLNSDAQTGNYTRRNEQNNGGGAGSQSTVETFLNTSVTAFSESFMDYLKLNNQLAFSKFAWGEKTWNGGDGVALPTNRVEHMGQWDIFTERLNKLRVFNAIANGDFDTDSNIIIFGVE